jgi:hypothetical protein
MSENPLAKQLHFVRRHYANWLNDILSVTLILNTTAAWSNSLGYRGDNATGYLCWGLHTELEASRYRYWLLALRPAHRVRSSALTRWQVSGFKKFKVPVHCWHPLQLLINLKFRLALYRLSGYWSTALQAWRSQARFPTGPLRFLTDLIVPAVLWRWRRLSLEQKCVPRIFPGQ